MSGNNPAAVLAPSAPITAADLVLNLLLGRGGPLSVHALCRAGRLFGIRDGTIRVALTRLQRQGKIASTGRAHYAFAPGASALSRRLEDWSRHFERPRAWNHRWIGIHDTGVPRSDKVVWRHHVLAMSLRGFATLAPRLHVRPDNLAGGVEGMRTTLLDLGLAPQAIVFGIESLDEPRHARACRLWDRGELLRGYRSQRTSLAKHARALPRLPLDEAARDSLLIGRAAIARFMRDPMLPPELAPVAAREELVAAIRDYQRAARRIWRAWLDANAP
ncbi:MAG: PaaX family transcriptional regulator [Pseudomonadota bacterium]|jgi:phenylacetic acid degradation operon negative regulatory protein|nr:PaaX family transcriptional regulator [Pseudomonadota bacterium]